MSRPKLLSRITVRLPLELAEDILAHAERRSCSANEVVLNALENEFARLATHRLDYYAQFRDLVGQAEGRQATALGGRCLTAEVR